MKHIKSTYKFKCIDVIIGIIFLLFFISFAVILLLQADFFYYNCIDIFHLEEKTGLSKHIIMDNYRALMDYCSPLYKGPLRFKTLPSSASGLSHFEDSKIIFTAMYLLFFITLLLLTIIIIRKRKEKKNDYLLTSAITILFVPCIIGLPTAINFRYTFNLFHKLLFRNNDWLFDPRTDPIINLLPQEYFKYCAVIIVIVVSSGGYLLYRLYQKSR